MLLHIWGLLGRQWQQQPHSVTSQSRLPSLRDRLPGWTLWQILQRQNHRRRHQYDDHILCFLCFTSCCSNL
ncbi:unnamed protein product [Linum tenue]|uniref:Uncharacterized protein n=1 Tax=Linum tenue TaxID=586396 RepID=A0AAV0PXE9_9ROSI|nr:unnamed protein product [Linum tenue]